MPYKIYTYEDPYHLDEADFWPAIKALPHFCVARTLVNGLKDVMLDSIEGLICPLDNLVSHESVYFNWTKNISMRIQQYSILTSIFEERFGSSDTTFHSALKHNQPQFLEAIRLFIELGVSATSLTSNVGNPEEQLFVDVLHEVQTKYAKQFQFPATPQKAQLKEIINQLAMQELEEHNTSSRKGNVKLTAWYQQVMNRTQSQELKTIVVHGLHQFSPPQLRLLSDMDSMGITIVFLFNYQKNYSEIYSSWRYIYQCFDVPIHHDQNLQKPKAPTKAMQNASNALAMALGEIVEGRSRSGAPCFQQWHRLYGNTEYHEFANITEYAHFVSDFFEEAKERWEEEQEVEERGNGILNKSAVLRCMEEQVYTANSDVHTLLKIYYPDFADNRHFLSYPIGQFFSAIYRLWDYEHREINMDVQAIKECLSSRVLNTGKAEHLLRTFYNVQMAFENLNGYSDFKKRVQINYPQKYVQVQNSTSNDPLFLLQNLAIYNKYKVTETELRLLMEAIEEINTIAVYLFSQEQSHDNYVNFGKHFDHLETFMKQRQLDWANQEEQALVIALQLRLSQVKPNDPSLSGTFHDLQQGLYYYLKQKDEVDNGPDWIVKNFEQIDGDILQSKNQYEEGIKKVYHFGCLSQRDFSCSIDNLLPWPLNDGFIRKAYSPTGIPFQVYYRALKERGNFLRYALFYGLYFNCCDVRLSYVKQYGDEKTEPYSLLGILGVKPTGILKDYTETPKGAVVMLPKTPVSDVPYNRYKAMSMVLCPYQYLLNYVLSDAPVISGNFLFQKYFENLIINKVWVEISGMPTTQAVNQLEKRITRASSLYRDFFWFWNDSEIHDLQLRAKNYLSESIIKKSSTKINTYAPSHMKMRQLFGNAYYEIDISAREPKNPFDAAEQIAQKYKNPPRKKYSLHKVLKESTNSSEFQKIEALRNAMKQYLNHTTSKDIAAVPSDWCTFCVNRNLCMKSYLLED